MNINTFSLVSVMQEIVFSEQNNKTHQKSFASCKAFLMGGFRFRVWGLPSYRLNKVLKLLRVLRFLTSKNNRYHPLSRLSLAFGLPLLQGATLFSYFQHCPFPANDRSIRPVPPPGERWCVAPKRGCISSSVARFYGWFYLHLP